MLSNTFDTVHSKTDMGDAVRSENGLPGTANKSDIKAYVRLCTAVFLEDKWNNDTVIKYFQQNVSIVIENLPKVLNKSLRQKFRGFLFLHRVYDPNSRKVCKYTTSTQVLTKNICLACHRKNTLYGSEPLKISMDAQASAAKVIRSKPAHCSTSSRLSKHTNTLHLFRACSEYNVMNTGNPTNDFCQTFFLFAVRCEQVNLDREEDHRKAFSTMLSGATQKYFFRNQDEIIWIKFHLRTKLIADFKQKRKPERFHVNNTNHLFLMILVAAPPTPYLNTCGNL